MNKRLLHSLLPAWLILAWLVPDHGWAAGPAISIYSPYEGGGSIAGNHLLVQVQISGYRLDGMSIGAAPTAGVGYWTLHVDGADAGLAVSPMIMAPNAVLPRLAAGSHRIRVELVSGTGGPLNPPVAREMNVNLANEMVFDPGAGGSPEIAIILPGAGATIPADQLYVKVRLQNFRPDARPGGAGDGVWSLLVDGSYTTLSMTEIAAVPGVPPGPHTLTASLHGRDGRAIAGATDSSVRIMVAGCPTCAPPPTAAPTVSPRTRLCRSGAAGHLPFCRGYTRGRLIR